MIIWRFTDGKLGHENQSAGLVSALSRTQKVNLIDFPVDILPSSCVLLLKSMFRSNIKEFSKPKPDLIIGAGRKTHIPMLVAKARCGGKLVVLMRPSIPMRLFDLTVAPKHDNVPLRENVIESEGALNAVEFVENKNKNIGLMLIGGESPHYRWDGTRIANQIKQITEQEPEVDWTLTTSRRTPENFLNLLREIQIEVVPFDETDNEWMARHYAQSGQIWVTPDSVSMVYEALSSGAVTNVFSIDPSGKESRVRDGLNSLIQHDVVSTFDSWKKNPTTQNVLSHFNESARIADHILEQLL